MLFGNFGGVREHEVTDRRLYLDRRRFLTEGAGALAVAVSPLSGFVKGPFATDEAPTPKADVTTYNNFIELGSGKDDPARNAARFPPIKPWVVEVAGECAKPGRIDLDDLIPFNRLEERIYRLRCVEAWSMVIPWLGVPLGPILARFEPNSRARFVEFTSVFAPDVLPGQATRMLEWPYVEGLRMDEAMHPLSFLAVGLYGETLPAQNGAPIRLVVPWKYGFKNAKSIQRVRFVETMPRNTWNIAQANEYGFWANVNPEVDHPRWSQAKERRIGEFLRRKTLPFNGYADQVAGLYQGMDLRRDF